MKRRWPGRMVVGKSDELVWAVVQGQELPGLELDNRLVEHAVSCAGVVLMRIPSSSPRNPKRRGGGMGFLAPATNTTASRLSANDVLCG